MFLVFEFSPEEADYSLFLCRRWGNVTDVLESYCRAFEDISYQFFEVYQKDKTQF